MPRIIKWGIIGLGKIANKFATDLAITANTELYAVASRDQKNSDDFAKKYSATKTYNSYEALAQHLQLSRNSFGCSMAAIEMSSCK